MGDNNIENNTQNQPQPNENTILTKEESKASTLTNKSLRFSHEGHSTDDFNNGIGLTANRISYDNASGENITEVGQIELSCNGDDTAVVLSGVHAPINDTDAANKRYVDDNKIRICQFGNGETSNYPFSSPSFGAYASRAVARGFPIFSLTFWGSGSGNPHILNASIAPFTIILAESTIVPS